MINHPILTEYNSLETFQPAVTLNTTGKSSGVSAWLETPVLWKSIADVTQCEIHQSKSNSPGLCAAKRNHPMPNPQYCNCPNTHTHPGHTSHSLLPDNPSWPNELHWYLLSIIFPIFGTDYTGEITCEQAWLNSLLNRSSSLTRGRDRAVEGVPCKVSSSKTCNGSRGVTQRA